MGSTEALDAIASDASAAATRGMAAFNAALIRTIAPPASADAAYFQNLAKRWTDAASRVGDAKLTAYAEDQAKAADATARAIP
jgi:hypothetical protein